MSAENTAEQKRRRRWLGRNEEPEEEEVVQEKGVTAPKGRATPSRRVASDSEPNEGNVVTRSVGGVGEYVEGVRSELGKVTWPTREETRRLSVLVLITTLISALVLGFISLAFTELFRIGLSSPIVFVVVFAIAGVAGFYLYQRNKGSGGASPY